MTQIFHKGFNTLAKASILVGGVGALTLVGSLLAANRTPYISLVDVSREQPVPFSHKHHVGGLGIDCRYCHTTVEESAQASIPATKTCMTCHSMIWTNAAMLEPVRQSYQNDRSLEWLKVHDLPDFAYFNHSIHIKKGVGCQTCHGQVDQMPLMMRKNTLNMEWCLECHRAPEKYLRPRDQVFNMNWDVSHDPANQPKSGEEHASAGAHVPTPPKTQEQLGAELVEQYHVQKLTNCATCHR
ncbi:MAG TPA: cytochrome c3 family protein [Planctomycetota bacterium]|nr:cytochrome c3 family protein [Planctomycetota bacterium]